MKRLLVVLVLAFAALGSAIAQTAPAPAASKPATPYKRVNPIPPPEAPAVQRSKEATIPGDLRPERETVPQIRIPIGKGTYKSGPSTGGIDDSVARCRAKRTSEERERCEAGLDNI
ncbi:MAG TPA: hypothetical protein VI032_02235 [Burkholderiaceae bacterium]